MQGEIRPGYKQTEVGEIPEEWEVYELADLFQIKSGLAFSSDYYANSGPILLTPGNFSLDGRLVFTERNTKRFSGRYPKSAVFASGDLLVVMTDLTPDCNLLGKPAFFFGNETVLHNQRIGKVVLINAKCQSEYLYRFFLSDAHAKRMKETATGSTVRHTSNRSIYGSLIALPPLPEQRAIATALADTDALIAALEGMVAKKRDLKQAAMQHLLTGKTRLPGFSGEWETTSFAEIVKHHAGNSFLIKGKLSPTESQGLYPCFSASGQDVWFNQFESEGDAIVVSAVGSRCGKAFRASGKWCAIANTHVVWPIRTKVIIDFLQLFLNDEDFWTKGGSGQPFVQFRQSFRRPLLLPSIAEQTAIAEVLSDMDADLAALEAQAAKARAVKQGMMQELLTGRVRLV